MTTGLNPIGLHAHSRVLMVWFNGNVSTFWLYRDSFLRKLEKNFPCAFRNEAKFNWQTDSRNFYTFSSIQLQTNQLILPSGNVKEYPIKRSADKQSVISYRTISLLFQFPQYSKDSFSIKSQLKFSNNYTKPVWFSTKKSTTVQFLKYLDEVCSFLEEN